jgi:hypothetical protein
MHFRFAAQSSRSTSVIFNNPKVCTLPEAALQVTINLPVINDYFGICWINDYASEQ